VQELLNSSSKCLAYERMWKAVLLLLLFKVGFLSGSSGIHSLGTGKQFAMPHQNYFFLVTSKKYPK